MGYWVEIFLLPPQQLAAVLAQQLALAQALRPQLLQLLLNKEKPTNYIYEGS